jgi:endoglucanase
MTVNSTRSVGQGKPHPGAPQIAEIQIAPLSGEVGDTFRASVTATGSPAPSVSLQWMENGLDIPGATAPTFQAIKTTSTLRLRVVATNRRGSVQAFSVLVTVEAGVPPAAPVAPKIDEVALSPLEGWVGDKFSVVARATGLPTPVIGYQWMHMGEAIPDATAPHFVPTTPLEGLRVKVIASNSAGSVSAVSGPVRVLPKPVETIAPVIDRVVVAPIDGRVGEIFTVSASVSGLPAPELAYRWLLGETAIAGATSSTYAATQATDVLRAEVTARNSAGSSSALSAPVRVLPQAEPSPRPFFDTPTRGINVYPPHGNWRASTLGLTIGRRNALRFAGYDTLRIWLDMPAMMAAAPGAQLTEAIGKAVRWVQHAIDDGFKAVVAYDFPWADRLAVMVRDSAAHKKFLTVNAELAAALQASIPLSKIVLQFHNEPPFANDVPQPTYLNYATEFAPAVWRAIRQDAPGLTVCVSADDMGWTGALGRLDPARFDANTMFAFHFYNPGEITHHNTNWNARHLPPMPWPITFYPGGKVALIAAMEALVDADPAESNKSARKSNLTGTINWLWDWGGTPALIREEFDIAASWADANRIDRSRMICTEFGFIGEHHWDGSTGYRNLDSRARYEKAVRDALVDRGFGWTVYQCLGDFNHFEQTDVRQANDRLVVQLTEALGMTAPTPGLISDLTGVPASRSMTLSFTNPADATSFDYSLDDGQAQTLAASRTITGLTSGRIYSIRVRGRNRTASGSWSNAISLRAG